MKKTTLLLILSLIFFSVSAQKQPTLPYRTNGSTFPKDSVLAFGYGLIPVFNSPSFAGYVDRAGTNFGLRISNNRLSVRGINQWLEYPTFSEIQSSYVPQNRTITINGVAFDLSQNRSWSINAGVSSVFGRTGDILAQSGDYSSFYYPLSGNPSGFLTSSTGVTSITGTANQIIRSQSTGSVTLSLPQSIATTSTPIFLSLGINGSQGTVRDVFFQSTGGKRWTLRTTSGAETGANAGSDFEIIRSGDDSGFLGQALKISRATGFIGINNINPTEQLDVTGKARVSVAPTNPTDVVRLTDLSNYALLASPVFSGTPTTPTATNGTNTTQIASTAFVQNAVSGISTASNLSLGTATATTQPINNSNGTGVTLPSATASSAGLLSATNQTIAGSKTFLNGIMLDNSTFALRNTTTGFIGSFTTATSPLTGDRNYSLPDATGTLALTSQLPTYTASNGLNMVGNDVRLGGVLTTSTSINYDQTNFEVTGPAPSGGHRGRLVLKGSASNDVSAEISILGNTPGSAGGSTSGIRMTDNLLTVFDNRNAQGLVYAGDYSANFIPESLITRRYGDNRYGLTNNYTASGTGSATTISVPHGLGGITANTAVTVSARNAASAGISYVTSDATNINIVYTVAPASGTNNLSYTIHIRY